ncbi:MAG: four-carbon acid sugar kinase family protein [Burkholderiaceae bacterium]|nr:four-carbon acid sugar kinase family protein [Burkholderiaceae bacterium]
MNDILLGCIADDFTGATDLANNLVRAGMRVVQTAGVPTAPLDTAADAVVVSLKSRTIPAAQAAAQSVQALRWLQTQGVRQIYFKYCSTFDSTAQGNIGPVTDALMDALGCDFTIATPAFPDVGRTVFKGYLFVGDVLLHESGMQDHPLTPMTDPSLVRVLQAQTRHRVGLVDYTVVAQGPEAIRARIAKLRSDGIGIAIVDAVSNADLMRLGPALADFPLVTAGSGVAIALPANFGIAPNPRASALPVVRGSRAVISGSCSRATNAQVAEFIATGRPALALDPMSLCAGDEAIEHALDWARPKLGDAPILVYSTAAPESLRQVQDQLGVARAGELVERALARVACGLVQAGVGQLVVAGGETSGAVVQALGITQLQIGAQIDPGVPWCAGKSALADATLHVALKSGNFGTPDFFTKAFDRIA